MNRKKLRKKIMYISVIFFYSQQRSYQYISLEISNVFRVYALVGRCRSLHYLKILFCGHGSMIILLLSGTKTKHNLASS